MINKVYGLLGISSKAGKVVSGTEAVEEGILKRNIKLVLVAEDSSTRTLENTKILCNKYKIPLIIFGTIFENSRYIGKINRAVIGIKDDNLARAIMEAYNIYLNNIKNDNYNYDVTEKLITGGEGFGEN